MGEDESWAFQPTVPPAVSADREEYWRHFDNSVNAVSFGFVATAILISMFLVMAIFERFLRPNSPEIPSSGDLESQTGFNAKICCPSPKMTVYSEGVSVLMPGENIPTFIAHPAPVAAPSDRTPWLLHHLNSPANPNRDADLTAGSDEDPT